MLPQLPREPIRPEREQLPDDKEIWQPDWRCFCCQDTGTISQNLSRSIVPDYDPHRDKRPACQHPRCEAGRLLRGDFNYDQRFTAGICSQLDALAREDWRNTVKAQQKRLVNLNCVKSLRQRPRTPDEEVLAYHKHQAALAEANSVRVVPQMEEVVDA